MSQSKASASSAIWISKNSTISPARLNTARSSVFLCFFSSRMPSSSPMLIAVSPFPLTIADR